jgi:hypothetical protein
VDSKTVKITLGGGIPRGQSVEKWIHDHGIENSERLIFDVTPSDVVKLTELATAFRAIVRPGIQYPVKAYKYVCPRTAGALDRLHAVLADHWKNIE